MELGQEVWYADGSSKLKKGCIVKIVRLDGYSFDHCIIEVPTKVPTGIEPVHYVRDWFCISYTEEGPLNYMNVRKDGWK